MSKTTMNLDTVMTEAGRKAIKTFARNYKTYIKFAAPVGAALGTTVALAFMYDMKRVRKSLFLTEVMVYPIAGALVGATVGATAPAIIVFSPIMFLLGGDAVGTVARVGLLAILGTDDAESDKKKPEDTP